MKKTEMDIIQRLEEQENKAGYIKRLIREDIEKERISKQETEIKATKEGHS